MTRENCDLRIWETILEKEDKKRGCMTRENCDLSDLRIWETILEKEDKKRGWIIL